MSGDIRQENIVGTVGDRAAHVPMKLITYLAEAKTYVNDALATPRPGSWWEAAKGTPAQYTYDMAVLQLACSEDHFAPLGNQFSGGTMLFRYAPYTLARGGAEAAARAAWLLEPALSSSDLFARSADEIFFSTKEQEKITKDKGFTSKRLEDLVAE